MIERAATPLVYIDANVFVEFLEGPFERVTRLEAFFDRLKGAPGIAATNELSLAEVLGKQAPGVSWNTQKKFYTGLLCENTFIALHSVTLGILMGTAELRRSATALGRTVKLADAIHLVTASSIGCTYFLSSDRRIFSPPPLRHVIADDHGLTEIEQALDA